MNSEYLELFWVKVNKKGPIHPKLKTRCWEWTAGRYANGYGQYRTKRSHRISWEIHFGEIPERMLICHHCDNPICVNPKHLFLGTPLTNIQDMFLKGRANKASGDRHAWVVNPEKLPRGEAHKQHKLTDSKVRAIRRLYATKKFSQRELASKFEVCQSVICNIVRGKTWIHLK